jgi:fibronectin type 3 domain-containing protein
MSRNNDTENMFGIAMLMCDLSIHAAKAGGVFFKDVDVTRGKRYIYRIAINYKATTFSPSPATIVVTATDEKPLAEINDLKAEFGDRTATISWGTLLHKGTYTAYLLERSSDGKNFSKLTDLPYVHMSEKITDGTAYYVDSLETNLKKYHYRIRGINPFAETGPYSNVVSGEGKEKLFGHLILREGKVLEQKKVHLKWDFPAELEKQINGFQVMKSNSPDGPYSDVVKKILTKERREYVDETGFNNTYYMIKAIGKDGKEASRSFPYLVQIADETPPAVPVEITGIIDITGAAKLKWKSNTDRDLLGYRVFRSNSLDEEPVEVTKDIISAPQFDDTVNIRVLNKKVYYFVIAVDKNFNPSDYSVPLVLSRPDVLPPAAPVISKTEIHKDSVLLEWTNSVSTDISRYELTRIEKEDNLTRLIRTWYPSALVGNYYDRSLTPGRTYAYRITVYDSAGNKSETTSRQIFFEPGYRNAVTNVKSSVDREAKKIVLEWKSPDAGIKCIIYRKINDNPFTIYQTLDGSVESFTDKNIAINNRYAYKIQPVFKGGVKSMISQEIDVLY